MSLGEKENEATCSGQILLLSDYVKDEEYLFRGIYNQPSFIKEDGSVTTAVLKDRHGGVSVDRDGKRQDQEVITFFCNTQNNLGKKPYYKFLKMSTSIVRGNGCKVLAAPLEENPYHAEIKQNGAGNLKTSTIRSIISQSNIIDNHQLR